MIFKLASDVSECLGLKIAGTARDPGLLASLPVFPACFFIFVATLPTHFASIGLFEPSCGNPSAPP